MPELADTHSEDPVARKALRRGHKFMVATPMRAKKVPLFVTLGAAIPLIMNLLPSCNLFNAYHVFSANKRRPLQSSDTTLCVRAGARWK